MAMVPRSPSRGQRRRCPGDDPDAGVNHELVGDDPRVDPMDLAAFLWHSRAGRDAGPYDVWGMIRMPG
jgi:hypothetical protein